MMVLTRPPMPGFAGDFVAIDDVELQLLVDDLLLHFLGQLHPDFLGAETGC